jgi:serine/threonine protein kinase
MGYIAPERLTKNGTRYSIECDIYSLGMVFWEISSGRPPFDHLIASCNLEDGSMMSLAQNIVSGRRERHVEGTDPIFEDLYTRCWHPDPLERPSIDWIIQTLSVLLKQPSGSLNRLIENLSLGKLHYLLIQPLSYLCCMVSPSKRKDGEKGADVEVVSAFSACLTAWY